MEQQMRLTFMILILLGGVAFAGDDAPRPPQSELALAAIRKADAAQQAAREAYDEAIFRASKNELDELRVAMKVATKNADLDEANAIATKIRSVESGLDHGETPMVAANMLGRWKTRYQGHDRSWTITPGGITGKDGNDPPGPPVEPQIQGHVLMAKWQNQWVSRLTFVDDRFLYEAWGPGHPTNSDPDEVTLGVRDNEGTHAR